MSNKLKRLLRLTYTWLLLVPVGLILIGAASNQIALMANHDAMPVLLNDIQARERSHGEWINGRFMLDARHVMMAPDSNLTFLCDIFDFGDSTESIGDLIIELGYWVWGFSPWCWGLMMGMRLLYLEGYFNDTEIKQHH